MALLIPGRFLFISSLSRARPITRIKVGGERREERSSLSLSSHFSLSSPLLGDACLLRHMARTKGKIERNRFLTCISLFSSRSDLDERRVEGQDLLRDPPGLQPTIGRSQVGSAEVKNILFYCSFIFRVNDCSQALSIFIVNPSTSTFLFFVSFSFFTSETEKKVKFFEARCDAKEREKMKERENERRDYCSST